MIDILVAQLLRSIVRLRIIIAVRHAESALDAVGNHHRAVLVVLPGAEPEECAHAERVQMRDFFEHIVAIFHRVDALDLVGQRHGAHGFDRFLIHAAAVIIADLLRFRRGFWIGMRLRRFLRNLVQCVVVLLDQFVEAAPARIFRWNFRAFDPAAVCVHKKIVLRLDRRIHVLRINRRRIFLDLRLRLTSSLRGCFRYRRWRRLLGRRFTRFVHTGRRGSGPERRRFLRFRLRVHNRRTEKANENKQSGLEHPRRNAESVQLSNAQDRQDLPVTAVFYRAVALGESG